jgi:branched-chain amino acid transport system ATP-binding protein
MTASPALSPVGPAPAASPALECVRLCAGYGKLVVVRGLDLAVAHREILAVLGPNGAGKTTLLMTVAGFLTPVSGMIRLNGTALGAGSARRANQAGIVLVPDFRALFTELTPVQNLRLAAHRGGPSVDEVLDLFPALRRRARLRAGELSGGEQQMLALARALIQAPRVLLIDEMSMGLAPVVVESLIPLVRTIADDSGAAIVLVEQHVQLALEIADRAAVLVHGEVVRSGEAADLRANSVGLEAAYLGGAAGSAAGDPGTP